MQQILESVNYCHVHGIVHRDLKVSLVSTEKNVPAGCGSLSECLYKSHTLGKVYVTCYQLRLRSVTMN